MEKSYIAADSLSFRDLRILLPPKDILICCLWLTLLLFSLTPATENDFLIVRRVHFKVLQFSYWVFSTSLAAWRLRVDHCLTFIVRILRKSWRPGKTIFGPIELTRADSCLLRQTTAAIPLVVGYRTITRQLQMYIRIVPENRIEHVGRGIGVAAAWGTRSIRRCIIRETVKHSKCFEFLEPDRISKWSQRKVHNQSGIMINIWRALPF